MGSLRIKVSNSQRGNPPYIYYLYLKPDNLTEDQWLLDTNLIKLPPIPENINGYITQSSLTSQDIWTFNNLKEGLYYIGVKDSINNWNLNKSNVYEDLRFVSINKIDILNNVLGNITINIKGGKSKYYYELITHEGNSYYSGWVSDKTWIFNNLPKSDYQIIVKDNLNNTINDTIIINNLDETKLNIDKFEIAKPISQKGNNDGEIKISVNSGRLPIEAKLLKFDGNDYIMVDSKPIPLNKIIYFSFLSSGYYQIELKDNTDVFRTQTLFLNDGRESLIATITATSISNPIINDGKIEIFPINGISPFNSKLLDGPIGLTYPSISNNLEFNNLLAGTYRVLLTDAQGFTYFDDISIEPFGLLPINILYSTQNPNTINEPGLIKILEITGGYKPELIGVDIKIENDWINFIDYTFNKSFLVKPGIFRIKVKELEPLNNISYSNDIIIGTANLDKLNIINLIINNTSNKNKIDGKISFDIINGIGNFIVELKPIIKYPNLNYNTINIIKLSERSYEINNLPIGNYLLSILDNTTSDQLTQNIQINFNSFDLSSIPVIIGATEINNYYIKGDIFVNTTKTTSPYEWNIMSDGILLNKLGITEGPYVFRNLDLGKQYNIILKDGNGNINSYFYDMPLYNNELTIKSIENGISTTPFDTTTNIKINIEGTNPPFIYRVFNTNNELIEETLSINDLDYTHNLLPGNYLFEVQDNNFNIRKRAAQVHILPIGYSNNYYVNNFVKTDQTSPNSKTGTIKVEVSGGEPPYTGYLINEKGELINTSPNYTNPQIINNNSFYWGELLNDNYIFYSIDKSSLINDVNDQLIFEEIQILKFNNPTLSLNILTTDQSSINNIDGSINLSINGGIGPIFEINLFDINGNLNNNIRTEFFPVIFNNLKAGKYKIKVIDINDSNNTIEETITINEPLEIKWEKIKNTIIISVLPPPYGTAPFNYDLFENNIITDISGLTNNRSWTFNNLSQGLYKIKVTDVNNKIKETDDIIIFAPLSFTYTKVDSGNINGNGIITINPTGGDGNYKYTNITTNEINYTGLFKNLLAGFYNILVEDGSGDKVNQLIEISKIDISCEINDPNCLGNEFNGMVTYSQNNPNIHSYVIGNKQGYFIFEFLGNKIPFKIKVKYPTDTNFIIESDFIENIGSYGFYHNGNVSTIEFHVIGYTDLAIKNLSNGEVFNYTLKISCPDNNVKELPKLNIFSISNNNLPTNSISCNGTIAYTISSGIPPFEVLLFETNELILDGVNYEGEQWFTTKSFDTNKKYVFKNYHYGLPDLNKVYYINGLCGWTKKGIEQIDNTLNPDIRSGYTLVIKSLSDNPNHGCLFKNIPALNEAIPSSSIGNNEPSSINNINNQIQTKGSLFNFYPGLNLFNNGPIISFNIGNEPNCIGCSNGAIQINIFNFPFDLSLLKILNSNKQPATNIIGQLGDNQHYLFLLDNIDDKPFTYYVTYNGIETKLEGKLDKSEKIKCYNAEILIYPSPMNPTNGIVKLTLNRFSTEFGNYEFSLTNNDDYTQSTIINHIDNTSNKSYNFINVKSGYYNYKIMNILDNSIQCSGNLNV